MKYLWPVALSGLLMACSASKGVEGVASEYYWPADGNSVMISGELTDNVKGYGIGAAQARSLVITFNNQAVVEGYLNNRYEGQLTGSWQGQDVKVNCDDPAVSGMWREVRCSVEHGGTWVATLAF